MCDSLLKSGATVRTLDAGGVATRSIEMGTGRPVILLHGGGAGADSVGNWHRILPVLSQQFRAIAVDMIGFGGTAKPEATYSQDMRIHHLADVIKALDLDEPVSLIGNSMGGATALGVAVERPDLVRSLVLMGTAGLNAEITPDLLPIVNYDFTRDGMVRLIRALTNDGFVIDEDVVRYRHEMSLDPDTRRAYGAAMGWIKQQGGLFYEEDFISRVRHPTLVVNGKEDKVVPLRNALRFLELISDSWGYIIPHCGHWAMIERPDDFARATIGFLQAH